MISFSYKYENLVNRKLKSLIHTDYDSSVIRIREYINELNYSSINKSRVFYFDDRNGGVVTIVRYKRLINLDDGATVFQLEIQSTLRNLTIDKILK